MEAAIPGALLKTKSPAGVWKSAGETQHSKHLLLSESCSAIWWWKVGIALINIATKSARQISTENSVDVPFKEYVEHMMKPQSFDSLGSDTFYFFGDNNFTEWDLLFRTYIQPPYQLPCTRGAYNFGIAVLVSIPTGKNTRVSPEQDNPLMDV